MRSPLWELHKSLYTALNDISGLTAYSFIPQVVSYPYAYIERKESRPVFVVKGHTDHRIRVKLVVATNDEDISIIESTVNSIEAALATNLVLDDDWVVAGQSEVPEVDVFPATSFDGSQGHAAEIYYNFAIQDRQ